MKHLLAKASIYASAHAVKAYRALKHASLVLAKLTTAYPFITTGIAAAVVVATGGTAYAIHKHGSDQKRFDTVIQGPLVEGVAATGTVMASQTLDLSFPAGFPSPATILTLGTSTKTGATIKAGTILAVADTASLNAKLKQAQSALASAQNKLVTETQAFSTQSNQSVSVSSASAAPAIPSGSASSGMSAGQSADLAQAQNNVRTAVQNGEISAQDAVYSKVDQFITNANTASPGLSITIQDYSIASSILASRLTVGQLLTEWRAEGSFATTTNTAALAKDAESKLTTIGNFLALASQGLLDVLANDSATKTKVASYQSSVTSARLSVNNAISAIMSSETQEVKVRAEIAVPATTPAIPSKQANQITSADLAALKATVASDQKTIDTLQSEIQAATLTAPVDGTIKSVAIKTGQSVTAGAAVVTMIPADSLEVQASISFSSASKIAVGNTAKVTVVASSTSNRSFPATVVALATSTATSSLTSKTPSFMVTLQFDAADPYIKVGQKAGLAITGKSLSNILTLPIKDITRNGTSTSVMYISPTSTLPVKRSVSVGEQGVNGVIQIKSGLHKGDVVLGAAGSR